MASRPLISWTDTPTGHLRLPKNTGYLAFAGQRDDGFYADVQAVFDLLRLRNPGQDSQGGFNLHMMALRIPIFRNSAPTSKLPASMPRPAERS